MANEKRKRQHFLSGSLTSALADGTATSMAAAELANVTGGVASTEHVPIILDPDGRAGAPEIVYVSLLTAGATSATIIRAREGTAGRAHASGTPWLHGPTLRDIVKTTMVQRTAGAFSLTSTSWADVTTGMDLVLPAYEGDVLEYAINGRLDNEALFTRLDVATMVSGSVVNLFSLGSSDGIGGWLGINGVYTNLAVPAQKIMVASDLSSDTVTMRLRYKNSSSGTKTMQAIATVPLVFMAKNLGPQPA